MSEPSESSEPPAPSQGGLRGLSPAAWTAISAIAAAVIGAVVTLTPMVLSRGVPAEPPVGTGTQPATPTPTPGPATPPAGPPAPAPETAETQIDRLSREIERGCIPFQSGGNIAWGDLPEGLEDKIERRLQVLKARIDGQASGRVKVVAATELTYDTAYSVRRAERNARGVADYLGASGFPMGRVETDYVLPADEQPLQFPRLGRYDCLIYVTG